MQAGGIGPLSFNTAVINWLESGPALTTRAGGSRFGQNLRTAFRLGANLLILDASAEEWEGLEKQPPRERIIDVWWTDNRSGQLMLILAYLMTRSEDWEGATLRILAAPGAHVALEEYREHLQTMLEEVRIEAEPVILEEADGDILTDRSAAASLVFLPFTIHGGRFYHPFGGEVADVLPRLPIVVLTLAAQDIDLGAEPEEGAQAEMAAAADRLAEAERELAQEEAAAKKSAEAAQAANDALFEMLREGADAETIAAQRATFAKAEEEALWAARKAARAALRKEMAEARCVELGIQPDKAPTDDQAEADGGG